MPDSDSDRLVKIRKSLFYSHLLMGFLGLLTLVVVLIVNLKIRAHATRAAALRQPTVNASTTVAVGVQRSLAALRGWLLVPDPKLKTERRRAWNEEIQRGLNDLDELSDDWTEPHNQLHLQRLHRELTKLKESQWWIEEVAQTPGNQPARVVLLRDVEPVADNIFTALTDIIDLEKEQPPTEMRRTLLTSTADSRGFFSRSRTALSDYVTQADQKDLQVFQDQIRLIKRRMGYMNEQRGEFTQQQQELLAVIEREIVAYERFAQEAVELRQNGEWNIAESRLESEAMPLANLADSYLTSMTVSQNGLMEEDAKIVAQMNDTLTYVSIGLIVAWVLVSCWLSYRRSHALTRQFASVAPGLPSEA